MCRHVLNAQASIRAPCCKLWFDCPQCHAERSKHELLKSNELVLACKKCRKVFRKDSTESLEEADEYCPHCDNHYVLPAVEPTPMIGIEGDDYRMVKDPRMRQTT